MANTVINPVFYAKKTQMFLRSSLVADAIASAQFKADLFPGKQIVFPYASTARVQSYTYSTDATIDATTLTTNGYSVDQVKIATLNYDPLQNLQSADMNWENMLADEAAYQLSRNIDQYVLNTGIGGALNTVAGGTLSSSNMFETLTSVGATLGRARAGAGVKFGVIDYDRAAVLANTDKANGFNMADAALRNGYVGDTAAGFKIFVSNDLPYAVTLTVDTQPTAAETFTVAGKTFTFRASGTAAVAGEISLGANVAATQANIILAINGTGTAGASTYIDLGADDRRELQNAQVSAASFSSNASAITAYGKIAGSETMSVATNTFGTETCSHLFGIMGAIDMSVQAEPEVDIRDEPKNKSKNILCTTQYGAGVYYRHKARLVKLTLNA